MRRLIDLRARGRAPRAALGVIGLLLAACSSSAWSRGGRCKGVNGTDGTVLGGGIPDRPIAAPTAGPVAAAGAAPAAGYGAPAAGDEGSGNVAPGSQSSVVVPDGPQIVQDRQPRPCRSAIDSTLLKARAAIIGMGGYVSDEQRSNDGDQATALVTYRIPAARWDDALDALDGLAAEGAFGEDTQSAEVTGQVVDLGARITNLQVTENALQLIMDKATKISDILDVQSQLTTVQGQIEELNGQLAHLTDQAAMGTLAVTCFTLPVVAVAQATNGWNLGTEVDRATAALIQVGQALAVVGLWLVIVGLPLLVGFLILVGLLVLVGRRTGLLRPRRLDSSSVAEDGGVRVRSSRRVVAGASAWAAGRFDGSVDGSAHSPPVGRLEPRRVT